MIAENWRSNQGRQRQSSLVCDLNDSRSGSDRVVVDGILAASQNNVGLAVDTLWHDGGEATLDWRGINDDGASNGDESGVDRGRRVLRPEDVVGCVQGDGVTALDRSLGAEGKDGERLDWERWVVGRAGDDELRGKRVDLVDGQGGIEWRWEW